MIIINYVVNYRVAPLIEVQMRCLLFTCTETTKQLFYKAIVNKEVKLKVSNRKLISSLYLLRSDSKDICRNLEVK